MRSVLRKLPAYLKMPGLVVTQDYIEKFIKANNTFLYQLVYDPQTRSECPVTPYPESLRGCTDSLTYCGSFSDPDLATQRESETRLGVAGRFLGQEEGGDQELGVSGAVLGLLHERQVVLQQERGERSPPVSWSGEEEE